MNAGAQVRRCQGAGAHVYNSLGVYVVLHGPGAGRCPGVECPSAGARVPGSAHGPSARECRCPRVSCPQVPMAVRRAGLSVPHPRPRCPSKPPYSPPNARVDVRQVSGCVPTCVRLRSNLGHLSGLTRTKHAPGCRTDGYAQRPGKKKAGPVIGPAVGALGVSTS